MSNHNLLLTAEAVSQFLILHYITWPAHCLLCVLLIQRLSRQGLLVCICLVSR